jgi:hypothetical protein
MQPTVPFEFNPTADEFEEHHLKYDDLPGGQSVSWPLAGVTIVVPTHEWYPDFDGIENANGGLVKFHALTGFSIGTYHEFLVGELPTHAGFKMGKIEVTFGQASPLIAYLFSGPHREKYFGTWDSIMTARIVGADGDEAEIAFINAAIRYNEAFGTLPRIFAMDESLLFDEEQETHEPSVAIQDPPIRDIDPIRFYYHGVSQGDDAAACIYFYRVLEYYSFLTNKKKMNQLRHDSSLSGDDFAKQILQLITKDEKRPFLKLINIIAEGASLQLAVDAALIKDPHPGLLGEAIYSFRNSIVHGKYSHGYALQSTAVLSEDTSPSLWRMVLQVLAKRAMTRFGSKLL